LRRIINPIELESLLQQLRLGGIAALLEGFYLRSIRAFRFFTRVQIEPDNLGCRARVFLTRKPATAVDIGSR
jgi:hypothetical protein